MRPLCCAIVFALSLSACSAPGSLRPQFGPVASPIPYGKTYQGVPERVPQAHLSSTSALAESELRVSQTRLDVPDPRVQNYEVQLKYVPARDGRPEGLYATWMTGRQLEDGFTETRLALAYSSDGGRLFERVPTSFSDVPRAIHFDPTLEYDPASDRLVLVKLIADPLVSGGNIRHTLWASRTDAGVRDRMGPGRLLEQPDTGNRSLDKGWLAAGWDTQGRSVIYLTDVRGVRASRDGGETWSAPTRIQHVLNLLQPTVLDDGRLFVSYLGVASGQPARSAQALFVSGDTEDSLSQPASLHDFFGSLDDITGDATPGNFRTAPAIVVAQSPVDGRLFAVLHDVTARRPGDPRDQDLDVLMRVSEDGGRTWGPARNLTVGLEAFSDQFMPWIDVDAFGHLHLMYYESGTGPQADQRPSADVHVWYARSEDGGVTWKRTRLSANPIPSAVTRWAPYGQPLQFLGDYNSLEVGRDAVFAAHPVYEGGTIGMTVSRVELAGASSVQPSNPVALGGLWYEPATSGQGFQFGWIEGGVFTVMFFGHRDSGENLFLTGAHSGHPSFGQTLNIPLQRVTGGRFNALDPAAIQRSDWGVLQLRFNGCDSATATLSGVDGETRLQLQRLGRPPGIACP